MIYRGVFIYIGIYIGIYVFTYIIYICIAYPFHLTILDAIWLTEHSQILRLCLGNNCTPP